MKRIKDWWKKINTPYYKRTIENLQGDEKKDKRSGWFNFGISMLFYGLVFLTLFMLLGIYGIFIAADLLWLNTRTIIACMGFLAVFIFVIFMAQFIINASLISEIQTTLKHMTIQIKQLQKEPCNDICFHHFDNTNGDTRCRFCGKTVMEVFNEWLNQNQNKFKEEKK